MTWGCWDFDLIVLKLQVERNNKPKFNFLFNLYKLIKFFSLNENIYNLLKVKSNTKVGLSFSPPASSKTIIKKSSNKKINCLILDKFFLKNKSIQDLKIKKYYYTMINL